VDPSIIGGMVARVGSTVFDASVSNRLQRLRQRLDASI
jgi:F0F1-type ATP synthase delta subunit